MKVSVLIPTWQRSHLLEKALISMLNQTQIPDEVIVTFRREDPLAIKVIESFKSRLPLIDNEVTSPGVIYAENSAINIATGDIICFIDDDAEAPEHWIEKICHHFIKDNMLGGVGGPDLITGHYDPNYRKQVKSVGFLTFYGKLIGNHHHLINKSCYVDVLKGVNMAFRRHCLRPLDNKLQSLHNEGNGSHWELDLCLHVKSLKYKLKFDPQLDLLHHSNHDHFVFNKNHINNARNYTYVILKNFPFYKKAIFIFYILLIGNTQIYGLIKFLTMTISSPKQAFHTYIYSLKGLLKGIQTYYYA